jgi:hypothetical protein
VIHNDTRSIRISNLPLSCADCAGESVLVDYAIVIFKCNFCFCLSLQKLVEIETKPMHDHFLQRDTSPRIGLISEHFCGDCFGIVRGLPKTAAPEGLGVGFWAGDGTGGGGEGLWWWFEGEGQHRRTALLYRCGFTLEVSDTNYLAVGLREFSSAF